MMKDDEKERDILINNERLIFSFAKMTWNEGEAAKASLIIYSEYIKRKDFIHIEENDRIR